MRRTIFLTAAILAFLAGIVRAENACGNLKRRAEELRNGATNCGNAVSQKVMDACMVQLTFPLPDVAQFITPESARSIAAALDAARKSNDLQKCRAAGGAASTVDSTDTFLIHAATAERLKAILANIDPYVSETREPDARCPDGKGGFVCSCPTKNKNKPRCGVSCTGTCYQWGGKEGDGIDCSGLIAQGNPDYWAKSEKLPLDCPNHAATCDDSDKTPCPDLPESNDCRLPPTGDPHGTQYQLQLLKNDGRDNIENAEDFRAGDALYLKRDLDGPVAHVVQVVGDSSCNSTSGRQICTMQIIEAPSTGFPVHTITRTFTDGCYCSATDSSGACRKRACIAGGGTAP